MGWDHEHEWWAAKDLEGDGRDLFKDTILE